MSTAESSDAAVRGAMRTISDGPQIFSLELEDYNSDEEVDSLIVETADGTVPVGGNGRLADLRKRNSNAVESSSGRPVRTSNMLGFLRSSLRDALFSWSHVRLLAILAVGSMMFVLLWTNRLSDMDVVETHQKSPHDGSLGGGKNTAHFIPGGELELPNDDDDIAFFAKVDKEEAEGAGDDAADDDDKKANNGLPVSNVGQRVKTFSQENKLARRSHYRHDPLKSVYSSPLYANNSDAATIQQEFDDKMKSIVETYGRWEPPEREGDVLGKTFPLRDYPAEYLKETNAWQSDVAYVKALVNQSKLLVARVKEGIYATYGFGMNSTQEMLARRDEFRVIVGDMIPTDNGVAMDATTGQPALGIAYLNTAAWNALVRKLLHGMMSMEKIYVVAVGNANTYAGNNFQQSAIMEFNDIMEPVFDKLGMPLVVRNMGMNASTAVMALGGADIRGEADILWHIPDNRDTVALEPPGMADLLHKQAILSGERLPIILTPSPTLLEATNHTAWFGNIQPGASFCDMTVLKDGNVTVPPVTACRYVQCAVGVDCSKRNSVCWIPRTDYSPTQVQDRNVGYQKEGYPNFRQQKLDGTKLAMLVLHALEEALKQWEEQTNLNNVPLPNELWHVGSAYTSLRERVRTLGWSPCDHFMRRIHPSICHMQMHAYTEWTPRVDLHKRIQSVFKHNVTVLDSSSDVTEAYDKVDLWPKQWRLAKGDVDVHLIALASVTDSLTPGIMAIDAGGPQDDDVSVEDNNGRKRRHRRLPASTGSRMLSASTDKTWTLINAPIGFCDGSSNSHCNRVASNTCLLANYNSYKAGFTAHGQSGKLSFSIPRVREGIVLARFDWELENGPRVKGLPHDFKFIMTVNGNTTSLSRSQFAQRTIDVHKDLRVFALLLDEKLNTRTSFPTTSQRVDIDLEVSSAASALTPLVFLTHIYYA